MKKTIGPLWTFIALAIIICLNSCGSKSVTGADGKVYDSYQAACRNQDFEAAYEWIEKNDGNDDDKDYVFNAEMLYLTSLGTEEASNRIVFLLAEYQIPGTPVQEQMSYKDDKEGTYSKAKQYVEGIKRFNNRCDNVLNMALAMGNQALSSRIVTLYKQDIKYQDWYDTDINHYIIRVYEISWSSKQAAQAKYKNAFGEEEI